MNVQFKGPFLRDVKQVRSPSLRDRLRELIERVEAAATLQDVPHLRKPRSAGNYRIGVFVEGDTL